MYSRLNPEARIAVMQATDEARELGHSEVGADHVLLGLLANVRGETYALLTQHGLTFDQARSIVIERHVETPRDQDADPEASSAELDEDRAALRAIGIDLDKVREAVRSTFGDDITEGWGERGRGRGRGRRGGPGGHHGRHHHGRPDRRATGPDSAEVEDPRIEGRRGGGRGRRGPRSERFGDRLPFSPALVEALRGVRRVAGADDRERRRGPGGPGMTAPRLLLAIARSGDPAVEAVLGWADDSAALRAAIEEYAGQPTA
ncbi:Clp protease N-terminal domain-containing protein [Nocardioides sp.]|uniref:Clp protease N-terminal domain-containing protein n=1 Tax=Nocardioides sp. TaxID=35761 RepID=UPI003D146567